MEKVTMNTINNIFYKVHLNDVYFVVGLHFESQILASITEREGSII